VIGSGGSGSKPGILASAPFLRTQFRCLAALMSEFTTQLRIFYILVYALSHTGGTGMILIRSRDNYVGHSWGATEVSLILNQTLTKLLTANE
jgi:hypothetical protein